MFMLFLISCAPFFAIMSWDFFKFDRNFFAVDFGFLDLSKSLSAFWRRGSVKRIDRIFFAEFLVGFRRNAFIPAFATFSAPWIFTDSISDKIFSKVGFADLFFMLV